MAHYGPSMDPVSPRDGFDIAPGSPRDRHGIAPGSPRDRPGSAPAVARGRPGSPRDRPGISMKSPRDRPGFRSKHFYALSEQNEVFLVSFSPENGNFFLIFHACLIDHFRFWLCRKEVL